MAVHDLPGHTQAEAAARGRHTGMVGAVELLEDLLFLVAAHADALVADRHPALLGAALQGDPDLATVRRILDRIGDQIFQNLLQPAGIAVEKHRLLG